MGHYHGVATRFKVREEGSKAWNFFSKIFAEGSLSAFNLLDPSNHHHTERAAFISSIHNDSAYFDAWCWQAIEVKDSYTLFSSRASVRYVASDLFLRIFNELKGDLVVEEGDIVYREVYETAEDEYVIVFLNGEFVVREGFKWVGDEENDDHPTNREAVEGQTWEEYIAQEETWFPGWNINNLTIQGKAPIER